MKYDDLKILSELKEKGVITEEEFQREKTKILNEDRKSDTSGGFCKPLFGLDEKTYLTLMHISQLVMNSVQDVVENKAGCFEWFGLDFMVDERFDTWILECNISPDMSRGTEVLERLVPTALQDLWAMLLTPSTVAKSGGGGWELVFRGKEIKSEVLQKRFWRRKTLMTDLRAGRPFSQRDALVGKLGASTNAFLQVNGAPKGRAGKAKKGKGKAKKKK